MQTKQNPLILTLRLDNDSQAFFDALRTKHFPPERNFLKAHLTLLHHLTNKAETLKYLETIQSRLFLMKVSGLRHLGAGVAYQVDSPELQVLHQYISRHFRDELIAQDLQPFKPHITIQNKVSPESSKQLLVELNSSFTPFEITACGLDLWQYLGGPWQHIWFYDFINLR